MPNTDMDILEESLFLFCIFDYILCKLSLLISIFTILLLPVTRKVLERYCCSRLAWLFGVAHSNVQDHALCNEMIYTRVW
jgi:hypothetical protein